MWPANGRPPPLRSRRDAPLSRIYAGVDEAVGKRRVLRGTDVHTVMTRVESALSKPVGGPKGSTGPLFVGIEGDEEIGVARMRPLATVRVDFPSGSARPVFGPAIRLTKRAVRRCLRWYVGEIMDQQSLFNHSLLDLVERLRVQNERLQTELRLRTYPRVLASAVEEALRGCQRVLVLGTHLPASAGPPGRIRRPHVGDDWSSALGRLPPAAIDGLLLEHAPTDPPAVFEAAHRALGPEGVLVLTGAASELGDAASAVGFVDVRVEPGLITARGAPSKTAGP